MSFVFLMIFGCGGIAAVFFAFDTFASGSAHQGHWGPRTVRHESARAPYREAALHETKPQGAPIWLRLASGLGILFGALTAGLLAPSGYLFALILFERDLALLGVLTIAVSTSGFAAGSLLITSARRAARGEQTSRTVMTYLYLHHLLTLLVTGADWVSMNSDEGQLFVLAACTLGLVLAFAYGAAPSLRGGSMSQTQSS